MTINSSEPESVQSEKSVQPADAATSPPKLLLVDGHALVYRAYHALPPDLRTASGEPTNAVYGFTQMLLDTLRNQAPQYAIVTFDKGRTFRHEASADYKSQRGPMPDDLRDQLGRVREVVQNLGIPIEELAGFEADDLIGTLSRQAEEMGVDTYILTADTDQHQLISDHVKMIAPGGYAQRFAEAKIYDVPAVHERYGFGPELVPDFKALVGDKTDNIANVPGIGDKTASALLNKYGNLEGILDHLDELKPKQQETLRAHAEQARHSKVLATIVRDAPVQLDLEASRMQGFDREKLLKLMQELEFRSLVNKIYQVEAVVFPQPATAAPEAVRTEQPVQPTLLSSSPQQLDMFADPATPAAVPVQADTNLDLSRRSAASALAVDEERLRAGVPASVEIVNSSDALRNLAERLRASGRFTVDVESTSKDDMTADLVGIAIALPAVGEEVEEGFYIPVGHLVTGEDGIAVSDPSQLSMDEVRAVFGPLLADAAIPKDAHNVKYDMKVLVRSGMPVVGLGYDTMLAAYLAGETSISLKDLAFTKLGVQMVPITELIGKGRTQTTMDNVPVELSAGYASADVAVTERLRQYYTPILTRDGLEGLLLEVEMPLVSVLADMELTGVAIDVPWLQKLSTDMHAKITELQDKIYEEAKHPFNIGSTQQLGKVLFEELQLPGRKRTQTGYSTDREVLDTLRGLHPIVDLVVEYRQLIKLKNTYIDALPLLVNRTTGRVHTSFNQAVAATGRLSSSEPNLQNIPIRTEIGRDVRKAFIAGNSPHDRLFSEDSVLLAADYSQIELRLLAHMAREERLVQAFEAGLDIHAATAAEVMGVPIEQVDPDSRRLAKTINFGVLYGMGSYGLARDSGLSQAEAAKFIELYWSRYPAVRAFMDRTLQEGRETGYVSTLLGRRRYMPELRSRNGGLRQQAERMAINAPVQGTAADIIKIAMNRMHHELKTQGLKSKMLLQVHDELLFEVPLGELQQMVDLVCETMEGAMELSVPLRVELKYGKNWGEMQSIKAGA
ncbi:MAG: DNA polymerase I [Chloroflexota bacterium]